MANRSVLLQTALFIYSANTETQIEHKQTTYQYKKSAPADLQSPVSFSHNRPPLGNDSQS